MDRTLLLAITVCLFFFTQAKAEVITFEVVDHTPNQSYSAAGNGIAVIVSRIGQQRPEDSYIMVSNVSTSIKGWDAVKFGEEFNVATRDSKNNKTKGQALVYVDPRLTISAIPAKDVQNISNSTIINFQETVDINRRGPGDISQFDPNYRPYIPADRRYRVEVTDYVPGENGSIKSVKLNIKPL